MCNDGYWAHVCRLTLMGLLIGGSALFGRAASAQVVPTVWTPPTAFPIGMWCSPPEPYITLNQYKHIADSGFSIVLPPCEGKITPAVNHKILDTARAAGLQ